MSAGVTIHARVIDMPIFYDDPWTHETLMRFRDRHQAPELTDLEYSARLNGFDDVQGLIDAHSSNPFIATFIGFVPGNAESYQLVPRDRQLEVPKYLRPRTDTPERALGHGGAFTTIYPVRGAGGFQLFGRSPLPVFDAEQRLPDFADSIVLPRSGDIFKYRPIDRDEYDDLRRCRGPRALSLPDPRDRVRPGRVHGRPGPRTTATCWRYWPMIEVTAPGLHSSIQDRGRTGYYALGIPPSGAMDLLRPRRRERSRRQRPGRRRDRDHASSVRR